MENKLRVNAVNMKINILESGYQITVFVLGGWIAENILVSTASEVCAMKSRFIKKYKVNNIVYGA